MAGRFAFWKAQPRMFGNLVGKMARRQFGSGRRKIAAKMPGEKAIEEINETIDDEEPGEEEMPAPAGGKVLIARNRDPGREGARCKFAIDDRCTEDPGRRKRDGADTGNALDRIAILDRAD